jgi:dienelactone hydrolase
VPSAPSFTITPAMTAYDERFEIAVGGLAPGESVTIEATIRDELVTIGTSRATYEADQWGWVDPSTQPPIEGSFDVADCMAFIWAAGSRRFPAASAIREHEVEFRALVKGNVVAKASAIRTGLDHASTFESLSSPDLVADFYAPPSSESVPAMLVLGGSEGGLPGANVPKLLATHGYAALAVAYFRLPGLPNALESIPLEYFGNAIRWLHDRPEVDPERIGVIGYSRGAELALLLGSHYPELRAMVSVSGSGIVGSGIDWNNLARPLFPAWTWQGEPIPFADTTFDPSDPASLARISIEVERSNGPVILIAGEADQLWDSVWLSRFAWDRLEEADRDWPDQFLSYPGAGHMILPPYQPMTFPRTFAGFPLGGNARDDTAAGADSWRAILNMLEWRFQQAG